MKTTEITCSACSAAFVAQRSDAKTCSAACRESLRRARRAAERAAEPLSPIYGTLAKLEMRDLAEQRKAATLARKGSPARPRSQGKATPSAAKQRAQESRAHELKIAEMTGRLAAFEEMLGKSS